MSFFKDRNCYMKDYNLSLMDKIRGFDYLYLFFISLIVFIGLGVLYSVGAGNFSLWGSKQAIRFVLSLGILFVIAFSNLRLWMKYAYWIYAISLLMLVAVDLVGYTGMGAQRWLNLGIMKVQPSEVMKIALVLALARYFHAADLNAIRSIKYMIPPVLMMAIPVLLILKQPDLGTAMMLVFMSFTVFFLVGVQIWKFIVLGLAALGAQSILEQAKVYKSLSDCLSDIQYSFATTARIRDMVKPVYSPQKASLKINTFLKSNQKVALIFGPERTGLENEDIILANALLSVDLNPQHPSLNLAQAVLLIGWSWWQNKNKKVKKNSKHLAGQKELDKLLIFLEEVLDCRNYFQWPEKRQRMVHNMRNIFIRNELTDSEVKTLYRIIKTLSDIKN